MLIKAFDKLSSFRHTGNGQYDKCIDPSGAETGIFLHNKIKTMCHYSDVTMKVMASQITGIRSVCSAVSSSAHQRKHQSTVSLAFVRETTADRWIPSQRASNAAKYFHLVTLWRGWRHHGVLVSWQRHPMTEQDKRAHLNEKGRFKNIYELLNPRALKISMLY